MFRNLLVLVREHAGEPIVKNPAIPNHQNDDVIREATCAIINGLKSELVRGGRTTIKKLFRHYPSGDQQPVIHKVSSLLKGDLVSKFGINDEQAAAISSFLVPQVLHKLILRVNNPQDDSFSLRDVFSALGHRSGWKRLQAMIIGTRRNVEELPSEHPASGFQSSKSSTSIS